LATATLHPPKGDATASVRADIRRLHRAPEPEVLKPLLRDAALDPESRRRVESRALGMLADMCAEKGLRVAYENWCWATRAPTWRSVWNVVRRADRPNLGLCLDTFQLSGAELADPTTASGYIEGINGERLHERWKDSLNDLATSVPADKIYLLQISDGYRMNPPVAGEDEAGQRPRSRWSHAYRPLPCDGGYLPVREVLDAVLATGFRGWLSVEVFDPDKERAVSAGKYTSAAMGSLRKLLSMT